MEEPKLVDINVVKNYYNELFTNSLLESLQKETSTESLIVSFLHYSNLLNPNNQLDQIEVKSDYMESEEEVTSYVKCVMQKSTSHRLEELNEMERNLNHFDYSINEEEFERQIENMFNYLNSLLESYYDEYTKGVVEPLPKDITQILKRITIEKEGEIYRLFNQTMEESQMIQILLIMLSNVIRGILDTPKGRELIFSNYNICKILLKAIYIQNIYIQILTLKNLRKYIIEDKKECLCIHAKMIKICLFSNSLCSVNRANGILQWLLIEDKYVNQIFDFYFLKKMKKTLEKPYNIQRLRILDFIVDGINSNNETCVSVFQIKKESSKQGLEKYYENNKDPMDPSKSDNMQLFEENYETYTLQDMPYFEKREIQEIMEKNKLIVKEVAQLTKMNVYKYLYTIYCNNDILLKVNVLEIFSKLIKHVHYCERTEENICLLFLVLNDLKDPNQEILHISIMNALISYAMINESILSYIINAHSHVVLHKIVEYLNNDGSDVEKTVIGLNAFGYFFSEKESSDIFLKMHPKIYMTAVEKINTHAHKNILKHSINVWLFIMASKSKMELWLKQLIHDILLDKVLMVLKEIDDTSLQTNIFNLLFLMIPCDICNNILKETWLINNLPATYDRDEFHLKMSRYNFFSAFLKEYDEIIKNNNMYAYNVIKNYINKFRDSNQKSEYQ